ncbi:phage minor capsid protein [Brevibacillus borstelensis]|uniref:phage minor capsid protein n=1 Tax=Brevibacillus borstelensis TaxID=45462 RepID=UPI00287F4EC9|nr:phage minor capsid protein [Brevibacillus borstelensis]WNF07469.1 phage minor capsid protein [Brevibacillus borstelensis]
MRRVPEPNYEYEIARLVSAYTKAMYRIATELQRLDVTDITRANAQAALAEVVRILSELNGTSAEWVTRNLPIAATDGVAAAIFALGVAETFEEARNIAKFNRMNKAMVDAIIADTQSDLLAVTQNVERKVRAAVRQVTAESMRANMARGVNGRRTISRDVLDGLRKKLGDSVNTGIVDAAGRRWKPDVYVDMVTRTKMMFAHQEATVNEAAAREAYYGVISRHGATDACRNWEGRTVKLTPDAPGRYPYLGDLRGGRDIFHPNCKHIVSPIRKPPDAE